MKKALTRKQKRLIGFSLLAILLVALVCGLIYVIQDKEEIFSVDTGVDASNLSGEATTLTVGENGVEITKGGIFRLDTNIESGSVIIRATDADVQLILESVSITNPSGPAIYIESADNFYLVLKGENTLTAMTSTDYNGAIFSKDDILISGDGSLNIQSNIDGIISRDDLQIDGGTLTIQAEDDGIVGKDSIKVTNGDITITAGGDGLKTTNETEKGDAEFTGGTIKATTGSDGLQVMANLLINGGNLTFETADDGIHSDGNIEINQGNIQLTSGDDGIHANGGLAVNNGNVTIANAYEGIEAGTISINGGIINVTAIDDGFNAAGGSDTGNAEMAARDNFAGDASKVLTINGGDVSINSGGDGLDSNGNLYIAGGNVRVDGPTNDGNGAVDYGDTGCEFKITGGTLIAVGSSGMAVNATSSSQPSVLVNLTSIYSGQLSFGGLSFSPAKNYSSVLLSSSDLKLGSSYDLAIAGNKVQSVTINNVITTSGAAGMRPGMGQGRQGGQPGARR